MTLEELIARECVRDTYARYNHAGDRGRLTELADCFTEDGVLELKGRLPHRAEVTLPPPSPRSARGSLRPAIRHRACTTPCGTT